MEWFDEFEDIDTVATKPAPRERELVPEGEHTFTVTRVSATAADFKLCLVHDDERLGWVFCTFPLDKDWGRRLLGLLARSLGFTQAPWKNSTPEDLEGRRVVARVYHRAVNAGRTFVNVSAFRQDKEQLVEQAAVPAKRAGRQTKRSRPSSGGAAMTSPSEDDKDHAEATPVEPREVIDMRRVSVRRLERIVAESRSQAEQDYHEARWDEIWGR